MNYCFLSPYDLTPTEDVDEDQVRDLEANIVKTRRWQTPITAHRDAMFVMDGHHRLAVAKRLQLHTLPVILLDYSCVQVEAWRHGEIITPDHVFAMALSNRRFPPKTTRHIFMSMIPSCDIPLQELRHPHPSPAP